MPDAEFLHGVETISTTVGPRKIEEVRTAVVHLTGTAPIHQVAGAPAAQNLTVVRNEDDASQFGTGLAVEPSGYTIPAALRAFLEAGAGTVIVTNVFDPATHKTAVAETAKTITDGVITLNADLIKSYLVVKTNPGEDPVTCEEGTDYTVDTIAGTVTIIEDGLLDGEDDALVTWAYGHPAAVDSTTVVGTDTGGVRTGMQRAKDAQNAFGFGPKILIAPSFSAVRTVQNAMTLLAQKGSLRAIPIFDVTAGTGKADVLTDRVDASSALGIVDKRAIYAYPHLKWNDSSHVVPPSAYVAAMICQTDRDFGYWCSPSNKQLPPTIIGLEQSLSSSINDPTCDVNQLNAAGVMTVFTSNGLGLRTWGNRTAIFPGDSGIESFIPCVRTRDVLEESIEIATLRYLDGPINDVLVNNVLADTNEFIRTLIGRGALFPGSAVTFDPAKNPASELADGHIRWTITFCPPPPAERITYDSVLDTTLLKLG